MFHLKEICLKLSSFEFLLLPFIEKVQELSLNLNVFRLAFSSGHFAFAFHKQTCLEELRLKKHQIHKVRLTFEQQQCIPTKSRLRFDYVRKTYIYLSAIVIGVGLRCCHNISIYSLIGSVAGLTGDINKGTPCQHLNRHIGRFKRIFSMMFFFIFFK